MEPKCDSFDAQLNPDASHLVARSVETGTACAAGRGFPGPARSAGADGRPPAPTHGAPPGLQAFEQYRCPRSRCEHNTIWRPHLSQHSNRASPVGPPPLPRINEPALCASLSEALAPSEISVEGVG